MLAATRIARTATFSTPPRRIEAAWVAFIFQVSLLLSWCFMVLVFRGILSSVVQLCLLKIPEKNERFQIISHLKTET